MLSLKGKLRLVKFFEKTEPGLAERFCESSAVVIEVFFDDFNVEHTKSPVIQQDDYYPFGMKQNAYLRENEIKNKYLYNGGSELQEDLGLEIYGTAFRGYDPALGRFMQIDPLADYFSSHTPYNYAYNNPIYFNDPMGLSATQSPGLNDIIDQLYRNTSETGFSTWSSDGGMHYFDSDGNGGYTEVTGNGSYFDGTNGGYGSLTKNDDGTLTLSYFYNAGVVMDNDFSDEFGSSYLIGYNQINLGRPAQTQQGLPGIETIEGLNKAND
jgi:RHS repeat-associated protein